MSSAVVVRRGVDYAWARPSPTGLHSAGYTFAARYLSYDTTGKNLTASEAQALQAAGIDVVSNWEYGASDALKGRARGVSDAEEAQRQAVAAGMPAERPIYFSVDFDATAAQQAAINDYFDGVASVIGISRTGAYGGFFPIRRLFDAGKIAWGWQTFAWSGGQWEPRAQLRQVQNGVTIAGGACDIDEAQTADFGQWHPVAPPEAADGTSPDFDGDGHPDLVATWLGGIMTAYLNTGTPGQPAFGFQQNIGSGWNNITRIVVVDADNDGKQDLLGVWGNGTLTAYLNTSTPGSVGFGVQLDIGTGWNGITKIDVVDADNDGKQDLVATWPNGTMTAYLNTGTPGHPAFGVQFDIGTAWDGITKIVVVDADNDGKQDLVGTWANGTLTAYLNTGTPGHPGFGVQLNIGSGWSNIAKIVIVDADNDGKQDLVATWPSGTMTAYLNTGTPGHPGFGVQSDIGTAWNGITKIVVADADNDGKQDLLGTWGNGTMTAYLNTGTPGHPGFNAQLNIGSSWNDITRIATVH